MWPVWMKTNKILSLKNLLKSFKLVRLCQTLEQYYHSHAIQGIKKKKKRNLFIHVSATAKRETERETHNKK